MHYATLTLHEDAWLRDGPIFASGQVTGYRVGGMPDGKTARIASRSNIEFDRLSRRRSSNFAPEKKIVGPRLLGYTIQRMTIVGNLLSKNSTRSRRQKSADRSQRRSADWWGIECRVRLEIDRVWF
jgi:hypothetical protein